MKGIKWWETNILWWLDEHWRSFFGDSVTKDDLFILVIIRDENVIFLFI